MSDIARARTVRRLFRLRRDVPGPVAADQMTEQTTVDLTRAALEARVHLAENRLCGAEAKVDAVLARTKDRRHRDDLLDIRLQLTGRTSS